MAARGVSRDRQRALGAAAVRRARDRHRRDAESHRRDRARDQPRRRLRESCGRRARAARRDHPRRCDRHDVDPAPRSARAARSRADRTGACGGAPSVRLARLEDGQQRPAQAPRAARVEARGHRAGHAGGDRGRRGQQALLLDARRRDRRGADHHLDRADRVGAPPRVLRAAAGARRRARRRARRPREPVVGQPARRYRLHARHGRARGLEKDRRSRARRLAQRLGRSTQRHDGAAARRARRLRAHRQRRRARRAAQSRQRSGRPRRAADRDEADREREPRRGRDDRGGDRDAAAGRAARGGRDGGLGRAAPQRLSGHAAASVDLERSRAAPHRVFIRAQLGRARPRVVRASARERARRRHAARAPRRGRAGDDRRGAIGRDGRDRARERRCVGGAARQSEGAAQDRARFRSDRGGDRADRPHRQRKSADRIAHVRDRDAARSGSAAEGRGPRRCRARRVQLEICRGEARRRCRSTRRSIQSGPAAILRRCSTTRSSTSR